MTSASLNPSVSQLVPAATFWNTPNIFIELLKTTLIADAALTHKLLESEPRRLKLDKSHTIKHFIDAHSAVRAKMTAAGYPNIAGKRTTIKFMFDGTAPTQSTPNWSVTQKARAHSPA